MAVSSLFTIEQHDCVAVVTFDDGKVNAISHAVVDGFTETWDTIESDENVRAVVFSGRPGQFCAGFDLKTIMLGGDRRNELIMRGWDLVLRLLECPVPVVIACTGNAVAGGAALLLTGDVRLGAAGNFKIGFNEVSIGIPLPAMVVALAADRLVSREVFAATAGARIYPPADAIEAGFLHRVFPPDDLLDGALEEAGRLASLPGDVFQMTKQALVSPTVRRMRERIPDDMELLARIGG
ncbi:MAG TPA: crotonase/enoyl-CoA hydratase family protein [Actinobacteria bacterium]|nr:crotonase/enoyl-CoA hydratase family protein [Actinomycetota bacterium]